MYQNRWNLYSKRWILQMSAEMWEFSPSGDLYFEKAVNVFPIVPGFSVENAINVGFAPDFPDFSIEKPGNLGEIRASWGATVGCGRSTTRWE